MVKPDSLFLAAALILVAWLVFRPRRPAAKFTLGQMVRSTSGVQAAVTARRYDTTGLKGWFYQIGDSDLWWAESLLTAV